jgi:hypothetical protein
MTRQNDPKSTADVSPAEPTTGDTESQTRVGQRLEDAHCMMLDDPAPKQIAFNHSAFCQTSLPYRNPDPERRLVRKNGGLTVSFQAGELLTQHNTFVEVGLPYGPRSRLVMVHLMTQAVLNQSPRVEVKDSLTAFAHSLGIANSGRDLRNLREQMRRVVACSVRVGFSHPSGGRQQFQAHIAEEVELFAPQEPGERVPWPRYVELNQRFFDSMVRHAVPLDPRALGALKHSAAALDCYQWLAQRLYRVNRVGRLVPWRSVHQQLGGSAKKLSDWKRDFTGEGRQRAGVLPQVLKVYPAAAAAVEVSERGLLLRQAEPPVSGWTRDE